MTILVSRRTNGGGGGGEGGSSGGYWMGEDGRAVNGWERASHPSPSVV